MAGPPSYCSRLRCARALTSFYPIRVSAPIETCPGRRAPARMSLAHSAPGHEINHMDLRAPLALVQCRTLVVAGEADPIPPPAFSEVIASCLPPHLVRFERFAGCGHG